jgi:predicted Zn finger-like uncharacterized protein
MRAVVVQCPSCSSKFRVADEKVSERGVRVRCTSCKNVFQVKKSGVVAPADGPKLAPKGDGAPAERSAESAPAGQDAEPPGLPPGTPAAGAPLPVRMAIRQARPSAVALRAVEEPAPDVFGIGEVDAAPPAPAPPRVKPVPSFDEFDLDLEDDAPKAAPEPAPAREPPPLPPPLPPSRSGEHVQLGAFKTQAKDSSPPVEMGLSGTGVFDLAPEARPEAQEQPASPPPAPAPEATPAPKRRAAPPPPRTVVSSALTGLLAGALVVAAVAIAALRSEAAARWLGLGPSSEIVAVGVASGTYETASGKPVFFVRGRVENRGKTPRGPVRVTAELLADGAPDGRAETLAGAEPAPEEVHELKSPADAEKLARALESSAVERSIAPGASVPFFAVIAEPPQDLERHRLRLRVEPVDGTFPQAKSR